MRRRMRSFAESEKDMPEKPAPATATILEKVMSKYTAEQVELMAKHCDAWEQHDAARMLTDYADLLRERESAKAGVTEEVAQAAYRAWCLANRYISERDRMRSALEAVAPMLASARAKQEPYCYTVEQKNGLSQGAMCHTKAECEASPLFDPDNDHIIPLYREPRLASARVPDAEVTALKNIAYDMRQQAGNNNRLTHIGWAQRIERVISMLAAAPKPETEE